MSGEQTVTIPLYLAEDLMAWSTDARVVLRRLIAEQTWTPQPGVVYATAEHAPPADCHVLGWWGKKWSGWLAGIGGPCTHWMLQPPPPDAPSRMLDDVRLVEVATVSASPWRSVDDPPEDGNATVWVCGGLLGPGGTTFSGRRQDRAYWAPLVEGELMPPLPEGVRS